MNLEHRVTKSPQTVFEYLSNMDKFVQIHPIVYKVEALGNDEYKFFEKLNVLMISLPITYLVKVVANVDQQSIIM